MEAGLAEPNPVFCLCSSGMFENLFAPFCRGTVRTEIVKAIGLGDECCEFIVHFDEYGKGVADKGSTEDPPTDQP